VHDEFGQLVCYEGTVEDVTELREYKERIEQQARYDDLTGLANRSLLRERLQQAIRAADTAGKRFALVFVDLASGDRTVIADDTTGVGPDFSAEQSLAHDPATDVVYVIDTGTDAAYAVDLTSGDRVFLSK